MSLVQRLKCDGCGVESALYPAFDWVKVEQRAEDRGFTKTIRWDYCSEACFTSARLVGLSVIPSEQGSVRLLGGG